MRAQRNDETRREEGKIVFLILCFVAIVKHWDTDKMRMVKVQRMAKWKTQEGHVQKNNGKSESH